MDLPAPVTAALGDEEVAARVPLKGEDALFVTPTRTLVYSGEGLLSDESVEEFPHDAERVEVDAGRRKAKIRLDYGLDGEQAFAVPAGQLEEALHPVLAGALSAAGVTEPGETVTRTYRFSELTLVVTSHRVVKHVGAAVWDEEYEEIRYEDVAGLDVEEGNVASQLVLDDDGRSQRIKVPNEQARDVRERVEEALLAYHDVPSYEAFAELMADDEEPTPDPADAATAASSFESDLDPIELSDPDAEEDAAPAETPDSATATDDAAAADAGGATGESATVDDGGATTGETAQSTTESSGEADPSVAADTATGASGDAATGADEGATADGAADDLADLGADLEAEPADSVAAETAEAGSGEATAGGPADRGDGFEEFETAVTEPAEVADELAALKRTVERQRELLARQAELIDDIAAELDDG